MSIIFRNYTVIKNTKDINNYIEYVHKNYSVDLSKCDINLEYLKKYANYSYKTCPKYLDWNHMINSKDRFTKAINNYYNNKYNNTDLFDVCIVADMTVNNRLSLQYLNHDVELLNLISDKFNDIDKLMDEIESLDCSVQYNQIYEYGDFTIKSDFILLIENNSMVLGIISDNSPNVNNLIHHISIAFLHNINCDEKHIIKKINLYVPLSGLIYQINIESINRLIGTTFLDKLVNIK